MTVTPVLNSWNRFPSSGNLEFTTSECTKDLTLTYIFAQRFLELILMSSLHLISFVTCTDETLSFPQNQWTKIPSLDSLAPNVKEISQLTVRENDEVFFFLSYGGEQFEMNLTKLSLVTSGGSKGTPPYRQNFLLILKFFGVAP